MESHISGVICYTLTREYKTWCIMESVHLIKFPKGCITVLRMLDANHRLWAEQLKAIKGMLNIRKLIILAMKYYIATKYWDRIPEAIENFGR